MGGYGTDSVGRLRWFVNFHENLFIPRFEILVRHVDNEGIDWKDDEDEDLELGSNDDGLDWLMDLSRIDEDFTLVLRLGFRVED